MTSNEVRYLACLAILASPLALRSQSWADFTNCISSSGTGATCSLPAGQWPVSTTLLVQRSGITITGDSISHTTLYRASSSLGVMMMPASGVGNVTIAWLRFDGRRYDFGSARNCLLANLDWAELDWRARSGDIPTNGVLYGSVGTVTVHDIEVINAPADGVFLDGSSSTISYSFFGTDHTQTKANSAWATRGTGLQLFGGSAGSYYSHIYYSGTAAVAVHGSNEYVYGNEFYSNRYEGSDGYPAGGQLYLESPYYTHPAYATAVAANTIDGANWSVPNNSMVNGCPTSNPLNVGTGGMEIYGYYQYIYDNEVKNHTGAGIGMGGDPTGPVFITTYNPWNTGDIKRAIHDNQYIGIQILGSPNLVQGLVSFR